MSLRVTLLVCALLAQQLPAPFATPWFRKPTRTVPMPDGHHFTVPAGFTVTPFADALQMPRFMALSSNGDVLPDPRVTGFLDPGPFLAELRKVK